MHGDIAYSRRVLVPFPNCPSPLVSGARNLGAYIKGEIKLGANVAQKGVSRPESVYSKNCIPGSPGRWTLGFCMEATQSLKFPYQQWFGFKAQENHF